MSKQLLVRCFAAVGLLFAVAACGDDGSDDDGIASVDGTEAEGESAGGAGEGQASQAEMQDALIEYAECMRGEGIDMPDPEVDSAGRTQIAAGGPDGEGDDGRVDQEAFAAADEECKHLIEDVAGERQEPDPEQEAEMQDKMTEMAQCMRDRGHDMPDPEVDGGRVTMEAGGDGDGPPERDEEFEADMEECSEEAGMEGPGGPIGPAGEED